MSTDSSAHNGVIPAWLLGSLTACVGVSATSDIANMNPAPVASEASTQPSVSERHAESLRLLLEKQIIPALRRGILSVATSRPPSLKIEITDDPSPYGVGAKLSADGALTVRLSLGYVTMHDAALDAVALAAALNRPRDLQQYLVSQLALAHATYRSGVRGASVAHPMTFARFVGIDPRASRAFFAQREWRETRARVEVESLGWTIAYLLVRADPRLAVRADNSIDHGGTGAARLAAASGWFPVPPLATALGIAEIDRSAAADWDPRALLCRAARWMEEGLEGLRDDAARRTRAQQDESLRRQLADIELQIVVLRRDGGCRSAEIVENATYRLRGD